MKPTQKAILELVDAAEALVNESEISWGGEIRPSGGWPLPATIDRAEKALEDVKFQLAKVDG